MAKGTWEPNVKLLRYFRSPINYKSELRVKWRNPSALPRYQSKEMKQKLNISFPHVEIDPTIGRVYNPTLVPLRQQDLLQL